MAKAPNPSAVVRTKMAEAEPMKVTWDGKQYPVRPGEVTARQDGEIRKLCGRPLFAMIVELEDGAPSVDVGAVILWLARTQAGEAVTLDEMLDLVTLDALVSMTQEGDPVDPPT